MRISKRSLPYTNPILRIRRSPLNARFRRWKNSRRGQKTIAADYPYLVCLSDDKIVGYAYAHKHHERDAYQWNAELSVYIRKDHMRCGIGKVFYNALMDILKMQNIRNVYGCVTVPNENSERFHESFGFRRVGDFFLIQAISWVFGWMLLGLKKRSARITLIPSPSFRSRN